LPLLIDLKKINLYLFIQKDVFYRMTLGAFLTLGGLKKLQGLVAKKNLQGL